MQNRSNYDFLTTAPIHRVIAAMALPTIITMLTTSIYNMADTLFVGQINTQSTAAVGITFAVMSIIQAIAYFFGQGSGTFISRTLGAKQRKEAEQMSATSFFYAVALGVVFSAVSFAFLTPICKALGSTPTILPYARSYMSFVLAGAPFMIGSMVINNQMRFQGNANYAMWGMLSGAIVNVVLMPIFIFVMNMGIVGAGLGTFLGQLFGFVVLLVMHTRNDNIKIRLANISFSRKYISEIFRGGTPSLTRQGLAAICTSLLNIAAGEFGDASIAGMSIVSRISFVILSIVIGIGHGFQPLCGFCYGAKLYDRVKKGLWFSIRVSTLFVLVCSALAYPFAQEIVSLFRNDPEVIAVGTVALHFQLCGLFSLPTIIIGNMMMQTTGDVVPANVVAAARNGLFFIPLILILPHFLGITGVQMCQPLSDACTFTLTLPMTIFLLKKMKKQ